MLLNIAQSKIDPDRVSEVLEKIEPYRLHLEEVKNSGSFDVDECSINLPSDSATREVVDATLLEIDTTNLKYVFVVGIGGANLGTKAIYEALEGFRNEYKKDRIKMVFIDTIDPALLKRTQELIQNELNDISEFVFVTVSKSGGTTETILNTEVILSALNEKFGDDCYSRSVVVSITGSGFQNNLTSKGLHTLHHPEMVGGRFSVFSTVGLFPLQSASIDVDSLLSGALDMRERCLDANFTKNYALQSAVALYSSATEGKAINTNFLFHPELESLGKWYRQLIGESIGKKQDVKGNTVFKGITPDVSIGSTDLHSMLQLYLGGPHDKITTFVTTSNYADDCDVPSSRIIEKVPEISGKSAGEVMDAIYEGVKIAYEKNDRPYIEVVLEDLSPYEIGAFMQYKMMEMMYLGKLFNVNTFNQPSVEEYKIETKRILNKD